MLGVSVTTVQVRCTHNKWPDPSQRWKTYRLCSRAKSSHAMEHNRFDRTTNSKVRRRISSNTTKNTSPNTRRVITMPRVLIEGFSCNRCGHEWPGRLWRAPLVCPACTSRLWDRPRQRRQPYLKNLTKPWESNHETQREGDIRIALRRGRLRRDA
jgi:predicted Zn-ribbon and HTH transcriptional regulator